MARKTWGMHPYAPKIEHLEVREDHVKLRTVLFIAAVILAVVAFGVGINSLLTPEKGWKEVECTGTSSGEISLNYSFGSAEMGTAAERRQVTAVYSEVLPKAEAYLGIGSADGENLAAVSAHPNETVTVDPILYNALESFLETGSRAIYFAPLYSRYYALLACQNDEDAALYDPARSESAAEFAREITAFALDESQIRLELPGENQAKLYVSEEYLAYAEENELTGFLDFGFLKNAFVVDAVAETLEDAGLTNGVLTTTDGFSRSLCREGVSVKLLEQTETGVRQAALADCYGPRSIVALRAFPAGEEDALRFYVYADGTVCPPVLDEATGLLTAANENLTVFGQGSVGKLAVRAMEALATWNLEGLDCLYSRDNAVYCTAPDVEVSQLFEGVTLVR